MTSCVPYIPLRGQVFFPDTVVGFDIGRDKSIAAVDLAMNGDKHFVVSAQKDTNVSDPGQSDCYLTGVLLRIQSVVKKNEEYERVLREKKKTYAEYRQAQQEMKEYQTAKYNVEQFLKSEGHEKEQQQKKKNEQSL